MVVVVEVVVVVKVVNAVVVALGLAAHYIVVVDGPTNRKKPVVQPVKVVIYEQKQLTTASTQW